MSEFTQTIREKVRALAENLPPDASWDDVIEEVRFRRAVDFGSAAADRGAFATDEEIRSAIARWGVKS
jgi:predicted transcriptional regulator